MKKCIALLLLVNLLQSCNNQGIDSIIERIDKADLSVLKGKTVHYRSKGHSNNTNIYYVSVFQSKCSPYVVEINPRTLGDLRINNDLVLKSCGKDYIDYQIIKEIIVAYLKLDICFIMMDDDGNIYINPTEQDSPTLLKKVAGSTPKYLDEFEFYKGNWFRRKDE